MFVGRASVLTIALRRKIDNRLKKGLEKPF
jgi:hypothetical protein